MTENGKKQRIETYEANSVNQLLSLEDSEGSTYEYDTLGNVSKKTTLDGVVTQYTYNGFNQLVQEATTTDLAVAKGFNQAGSELGVVKIDLNKVSSAQFKGYEEFARVNGVEGLPYHYSIWQQEISIKGSIPQDAIGEFIK